MRKSSESSLPEKRRKTKKTSTKINTKSIEREIESLGRLRDDQIDKSDIPEITDWSHPIVGKFYRPRKEPITIRLDADVVAWLKADGPGYQTRINAVLRYAMKPSTARTARRTRKVASRG